MTQDLENHATNQDDREGLNWARIAGITMAMTVHGAALLLLLAPMTAPPTDKAEEEVTMVNIIKPPPPPDPPPVVFDDPSPVDTPAPPPAPPAPPAPQNTLGSVDPSSRSRNPPRYPPSAQRAQIEGTVILVISIDAQGNVMDIEVEKSSRNRDLDRAAVDAARKWRFNPQIENGVPVASRVRVPVDFTLN